MTRMRLVSSPLMLIVWLLAATACVRTPPTSAATPVSGTGAPATTVQHQADVPDVTPSAVPVEESASDDPVTADAAGNDSTTGSVESNTGNVETAPLPDLPPPPVTALPVGWLSAQADPLRADFGGEDVDVPVLRAHPEGRSSDTELTVIALPSLGLTLQDYVEMIRADLAEQPGLDLMRSGIVYGEGSGGQPIGEVEYRFMLDDGSVLLQGYQAALLSSTGEQFVIVTYIAPEAVFATYSDQINRYVRTIHDDAPDDAASN